MPDTDDIPVSLTTLPAFSASWSCLAGEEDLAADPLENLPFFLAAWGALGYRSPSDAVTWKVDTIS